MKTPARAEGSAMGHGAQSSPSVSEGATREVSPADPEAGAQRRKRACAVPSLAARRLREGGGGVCGWLTSRGDRGREPETPKAKPQGSRVPFRVPEGDLAQI